jgi:hypothetical protein
MIQGILEFLWGLCNPRSYYSSVGDAEQDISQSILIFLGWATLALLIIGVLYLFVPGFRTTFLLKHF